MSIRLFKIIPFNLYKCSFINILYIFIYLCILSYIKIVIIYNNKITNNLLTGTIIVTISDSV